MCISNFVLSIFCQPYHLFEPFVDVSLPIAFEHEWEQEVSVFHPIQSVYRMPGATALVQKPCSLQRTLIVVKTWSYAVLRPFRLLEIFSTYCSAMSEKLFSTYLFFSMHLLRLKHHSLNGSSDSVNGDLQFLRE